MCTPQHTVTNWKKKGGQEWWFLRLRSLPIFLKKVVQHLTKVNKVNKVNRAMCTSTHWQTEKQGGGTGVLTSVPIFFEEGSTTSHTLPLPKKLVTKLTRVMCTPHHTLTNCEKRKGQVSGGSCTSLPLFFWKKVVQHLTKWTKWTRVMCTPHHTHWQTEKRKGGRSGGSYVLGPYLFFWRR